MQTLDHLWGAKRQPKVPHPHGRIERTCMQHLISSTAVWWRENKAATPQNQSSRAGSWCVVFMLKTIRHFKSFVIIHTLKPKYSKTLWNSVFQTGWTTNSTRRLEPNSALPQTSPSKSMVAAQQKVRLLHFFRGWECLRPCITPWKTNALVRHVSRPFRCHLAVCFRGVTRFLIKPRNGALEDPFVQEMCLSTYIRVK